MSRVVAPSRRPVYKGRKPRPGVSMDTDLLKTFLEVNRTRHFGKAADNLFVSQSAVSARIRQLEELVGAALFTRDRNNIQPTAAGQKLVAHAERILNSWNRARQDLAQGEDNRAIVAVAGEASLWDIVLQDWLHWMQRTQAQVGLYAEALSQDTQLRRLLDGSLDLAFLFESPHMAPLLSQEILRVPLILVSATPGLNAEQALARDYIMVDWGTSFAIAHARHFPEMGPPRLRVNLGRLALSRLLELGGSAYLAEAMVEGAVGAGRLHRVAGAPAIDRSAFAVYPARSEKRDIIDRAMSYFVAHAPQAPLS